MKKIEPQNQISVLVKLKTIVREMFPVAAKRFPFFFPLETLKMLCDILMPFIALFVSPMIIDELIGGRRLRTLFVYAFILIFGEALLSVIKEIVSNRLNMYQERLSNFFYMRISEHSMNLDFQLTEDKDALDQLEKANTGMDWYSGGVYGIAEQLFMFMGNAIKIGGFVTVIALHTPILILVILGGVLLNGLFYYKSNQVEVEAFSRSAHSNRMFEYFGWELTDFRYGKDIRLYDASDMLLNKWDGFADRQMSVWMWRAGKQCKYSLGIVLISVIITTFNCFYAALMAIKGVFSLGTFTQIVEAAGGLNNLLQGIIGNVTELIKRSNYAYEYCIFMNYPIALPKGNREVAPGLHKIEFRNVCFSYPGSDSKVLSGINLTIEKGERVSLVGLNGAGKTTLVKLLCRLYDPTEGTILLDGIDIREYNYDEYIKVFSPVFQDFMLFAFSVNENIAIKEGNELDDLEKERIVQLVRQTGLEDILEKFPQGLESILFKYFDENGVEPSGGEQQKIALARALYKDAPVVILDEPTSALDPIAEYEIYKHFNELIEKKTSLYISHRLSSCRFCNHIAVFSDGRIAEYGTHDELMKIANGIYAKMFEAQAQYYR